MTEMNDTMMENATAIASEDNNKDQTVKYDLVEQLARKMGISMEVAKAAMEAADWNTLTATHMLEQEAFLRKQELNDAVESCVGGDDTVQDPSSARKAALDSTAGKKTPARHRKWFSNLCDHLRRLVAYGNHNRFTIIKDGEQLLEMPVTALALLLFFSFGTCALLMIVGLFAGCRYTVTTAAGA